VTPAPTLPPPTGAEPVPAGEQIVKRVQPWQALVGIAVVLIGAGAYLSDWQRSLARAADVEQVRTSAAAQASGVQASTTTQLGTLQSQVYELRERQAAVEASLDVLIGLSQQLLDQSRAIAKATGARSPPAAAPPEPAHPPPEGSPP